MTKFCHPRHRFWAIIKNMISPDHIYTKKIKMIKWYLYRFSWSTRKYVRFQISAANLPSLFLSSFLNLKTIKIYHTVVCCFHPKLVFAGMTFCFQSTLLQFRFTGTAIGGLLFFSNRRKFFKKPAWKFIDI